MISYTRDVEVPLFISSTIHLKPTSTAGDQAYDDSRLLHRPSVS